ncbi:MAG: heavy metal-binding domain-containing protein [Cellulosilyticaceae bacterium]
MLIVNVDYISDKELDVLEMVEGTGEAVSIGDAKDEAIKGIKQKAKLLKADAVVNVRFESCMNGNEVQVLAYGTAVKYHAAYELQQF